MHRSWLLAGASAVCIGSLATPAWSQAHGESSAIEELVVTARKTEEKAQDVPVAITAVSPTRMRDMAVVNLGDVSRSTPNLFITRYSASPAAPLITIRGQSQQDVILNIDPPIGVYIDGVYMPHSFGLDQALMDVERIEVLKGPQGTLYGKNTTGGAISVITKGPDLNGVGGFADLTFGNYNYGSFQGALNVPLIQDKLAVRIVGQVLEHSGYGHDGLGRQVGNERDQSYRAKLRWEPVDNVHVLLAADYQRLWNNGSATRISYVDPSPSTIPKQPAQASAFTQIARELGLPTTPAGLLQARNILASYMPGGANGPKGFQDTGSTDPQWGRYDAYGTSLDVGVDLTDEVQLRSISSYRQFRRSDLIDQDGTPFAINWPDNRGYSRNLTEELQLSGRTDKVNWIVGGFGNMEHALEDTAARNSLLQNPNAPAYFTGYLKNSSWAVYGQAGYQLTEKLRVTGGLRWTSETKRLESHNAAGPARACAILVSLRVSPTVCQANFQNTYKDYSYLLSLDYKPTDGVLVYAKTARGFKGGGQNLRGTSPAESFNPFEPETVVDYEVGLKSDLLDRTLRINAAAFHTNYKNVQRSIRIVNSLGSTTSLVTNAARAEINGGELEVTYKPVAALTLNASGGVSDAKYKKFVDATGDRGGEPFQFPKKTWSVSGVYVIPTGMGDVRISSDYNWRSKVALSSTATVLSSTTQTAYGIWNGRIALHHEDSGFEVSAFGKNLGNKKFCATAQTFDNGAGFNLCYPGAPRTYGVEVLKKFGGG